MMESHYVGLGLGHLQRRQSIVLDCGFGLLFEIRYFGRPLSFAWLFDNFWVVQLCYAVDKNLCRS